MPTVGNRGKKLDLLVKQGSTFAPHLVRMVGKTLGEPIDLTGATIRAIIRKAYGVSPTYPLTCSVVDAAAGYFTFSIPASVTGTIPYLGPYYEPVNQYIWDLEIEFSTGFIMPVFYGVVKIAGEATQ